MIPLIKEVGARLTCVLRREVKNKLSIKNARQFENNTYFEISLIF